MKIYFQSIQFLLVLKLYFFISEILSDIIHLDNEILTILFSKNLLPWMWGAYDLLIVVLPVDGTSLTSTILLTL